MTRNVMFNYYYLLKTLTLQINYKNIKKKYKTISLLSLIFAKCQKHDVKIKNIRNKNKYILGNISRYNVKFISKHYGHK